MSDNEEILEQLEAKVKAHDADVSDLGLVVKDEYEETQSEVESLRDENDSLREEIENVKELYAEGLADATGLDADFFMDKDLEDLQDLHEEKVDEELVESPAPSSGDVTEEEKQEREEAEQQEKEAQEKLEELDVKVETVEDLAEVVETYEKRGGPWADAAEPYRETLEEIQG